MARVHVLYLPPSALQTLKEQIKYVLVDVKLFPSSGLPPPQRPVKPVYCLNACVVEKNEVKLQPFYFFNILYQLVVYNN